MFLEVQLSVLSCGVAYLMTLLQPPHMGVRVPAGMCSARCTRQSRSWGWGWGVGRSGPLGTAVLVTRPNEGAATPFGAPGPIGDGDVWECEGLIWTKVCLEV